MIKLNEKVCCPLSKVCFPLFFFGWLWIHLRYIYLPCKVDIFCWLLMILILWWKDSNKLSILCSCFSFAFSCSNKRRKDRENCVSLIRVVDVTCETWKKIVRLCLCCYPWSMFEFSCCFLTYLLSNHKLFKLCVLNILLV